MVVVMPYFPKDLKRVLKSTRKHGEVFQDARAVRVMYHLLLAVRHLKAHAIVHRDIKLDNVLLANVGMEEEAAVLTDFGMCFDLKKNQVEDFKVQMPYDGFRRGGAPIALAPEITLPKPGPTAFLDYTKNDEWAIGMVAHELMSEEDKVPFENMEKPATYADASYMDDTISERCKPLVSRLLKVNPADRIDAAEGSRQAKKLLGQCDLAETLDVTAGEYSPGTLSRIKGALERCPDKDTGLWIDLEARRDVVTVKAQDTLQSACEELSITRVKRMLADYEKDKDLVKEAYVALDMHRSSLEKTMRRRLEVAAAEQDVSVIEKAVSDAAEYGDAVQDARSLAVTAMNQARARTKAEQAIAKGEELLASDRFDRALKELKKAQQFAEESDDGPLKAHVADRIKNCEEKKKAKRGSAASKPTVTAEELGGALRAAISKGVPMWNSGDYAGCAMVYKKICSHYAHADDSLAEAVAKCEGRSTGSARDSQGWVLRNAMDGVLRKIRNGEWEPAEPKVRVALLASDFADHMADVKKHLARASGCPVTLFNMHDAIPSLATLKQFQVALVFTATWGRAMMRGCPGTDYDSNTAGDRLADFVDEGGSVVIMYCNGPPKGRWEREKYSPVQWDGVEEAGPGKRAEGPLGPPAVGPLWMNGARPRADCQVVTTWGSGPRATPFLAIKKPSAGFTMLLNFFPPSNECSAHGVADRLWDKRQMDGGEVMAAAVLTCAEMAKAENGGASDEEEDSDAVMKDYVRSWMDAVKVMQTAIDCGVPLFNHGKEDACYRCYSTTVKAILRRRPAWQGTALCQVLQKAVTDSAAEGGRGAGAWTMRHALDAVTVRAASSCS